MISEKIKKLKDMEARAAELKAAIERDRSKELAALPAEYGYDSMAAFIKALKQAAGAKKGRGRKAKAGKAPKAKKAAKSRKRAKITPEIKDKVKALVAQGTSGAKIAKQLGISLPSVQNIKKELGLVKAKAAKAAKPAAEKK